MKFPLNILAVSVLAATSLTVSPVWAADNKAVDPLACTPEEIQAVMKEYNASLGTYEDYKLPDFDTFKDVNLAMKADDPDDPDGLCQILADPNFEIPEIDMEKAEAAWEKLKLLMSGQSGGSTDWSKIIGDAYDKGMEKASEVFLSGSCKLAQNFSKAANEGIDGAYEDGKKAAKDKVENNEKLNEAGIDDLDKPLWKQVAEKENEKRLGEYADYAKWYEGDFDEENLDESMDDLVGKILGDQVDNALDKNVKGGTEDSIDSILDGLEPDYE